MSSKNALVLVIYFIQLLQFIIWLNFWKPFRLKPGSFAIMSFLDFFLCRNSSLSIFLINFEITLGCWNDLGTAFWNIAQALQLLFCRSPTYWQRGLFSLVMVFEFLHQEIIEMHFLQTTFAPFSSWESTLLCNAHTEGQSLLTVRSTCLRWYCARLLGLLASKFNAPSTDQKNTIMFITFTFH